MIDGHFPRTLLGIKGEPGAVDHKLCLPLCDCVNGLGLLRNRTKGKLSRRADFFHAHINLDSQKGAAGTDERTRYRHGMFRMTGNCDGDMLGRRQQAQGGVKTFPTTTRQVNLRPSVSGSPKAGRRATERVAADETRRQAEAATGLDE